MSELCLVASLVEGASAHELVIALWGEGFRQAVVLEHLEYRNGLLQRFEIDVP